MWHRNLFSNLRYGGRWFKRGESSLSRTYRYKSILDYLATNEQPLPIFVIYSSVIHTQYWSSRIVISHEVWAMRQSNHCTTYTISNQQLYVRDLTNISGHNRRCTFLSNILSFIWSTSLPPRNTTCSKSMLLDIMKSPHLTHLSNSV